MTSLEPYLYILHIKSDLCLKYFPVFPSQLFEFTGWASAGQPEMYKKHFLFS